MQDSFRELRAMFNNVPNLLQTIRKSIGENAELKKQVLGFVKEKVVRMKKDLLENAVVRNGVKIIIVKGDFGVDVIKDIAFQVKGEVQADEKLLFVAGLKNGDKCTLMVALSDALAKEGFSAGQLVKDSAKLIQGGGGGQPTFATAGGKNPEGIDAAVDAVIDSVIKN